MALTYGPHALIVLFVILVVLLGLSVVWLWGLIDSITRPQWAYVQARSNKALWIVLNVVLGSVGSLIYLLAIRPRLKAAELDRGAPVGQVFLRTGSLQPQGEWCPACRTFATKNAQFCSRCGATLATAVP